MKSIVRYPIPRLVLALPPWTPGRHFLELSAPARGPSQGHVGPTALAVPCVLMTVLLGSLAGCSLELPTDPPVATAVALSAATLSFSSLGETEQLAATVTDQNGATMSEETLSWESSASSVVSVSPTGLVTALTNGTSIITATTGSAAEIASVTVQQVAVWMTLSPASVVLAGPGDAKTLVALVTDAGDSEIATPRLTWSSEDERVATVSSAGVVTAVASGSATVTAEATSGGQTVAQAVAITVDATLRVTTTALPNGVPGVLYTEPLTADGGNGSYLWTVVAGSVPAGLRLASNGHVTGIPTVPGTSNFRVELTSGGQKDQQALSITVSGTQVLLPGQLCSDLSDADIATFEDASLEAIVMDSLSVSAPEDLTCGLLRTLTSLTAVDLGIASLMGIQNLTGLTILGLSSNSITDIGALIGLMNLTTIHLTDNTDLADIQPLITNPGLGAGDSVDLRSTGVSCMDVAALEANRVTVTSGCTAPMISNFSVELEALNTDTCQPSPGFAQVVGSRFAYALDYVDTEGDMIHDGAVAALITEFDSGERFTSGISGAAIQFSGDGLSGSMAFSACHWFGTTRNGIDNTVTVADAASNESNSLMLSFTKPLGANVPD